MKTLLLGICILSAAAIAPLAACSSSVSCDPGVDCGSGGMTGSGGSTNAVTPTTPGTSGPPTLAAILFGSDPLTLRVTTVSVTCDAPDTKPPFSQCGWEDFELTFPAALLTQGTVTMADTGVSMYEQESDPGQPGQCGGSAAISGGGGSGNPELIATFSSVAADSVTVTLTNVDAASGKLPDFNGTYVATRCP